MFPPCAFLSIYASVFQTQNIGRIGVDRLAKVGKRIQRGQLFARKIIGNCLLPDVRFGGNFILLHAALLYCLYQTFLYLLLYNRFYTFVQ